MNYEFVDLASLNLDPKNPRLPLRLKDESKESIVQWMLTDASLVELMLAIGTNGFFPGEPLIIVEESGKFIVVEGNRRLASLLLLNEIVKPELQIGAVEQVKKLTTERPTNIPVIKFDKREDVEKYLGFRHVTGVKEWSPLAKARYLKSIMSTEVDGTVTLEQYRELAKQIGSKRPYVQRLIVSYELYEVIETNSFFGIPDLDEETFHFTYLMDSLNRSEIREFLGIDFGQEEVLSGLYLDKLQQLIDWFFRRLSSGKTVMIADSRHLSVFVQVLIHDKAFENFQQSLDLFKAYDLTIDKSVNYRDLVHEAETCLNKALVNIVDLDKFYVSDTEKLEHIKKIADHLLQTISSR